MGLDDSRNGLDGVSIKMCKQWEPARSFQTSPQLSLAIWCPSNRDKKKSGPISPDVTNSIVWKDLMPFAQVASSGSVVTLAITGSAFSIVPFPIVRPIKRTVMVPPANSANSES